MVKLFVVLGLALLAGGTYAIVDGWPYLVLERGFTEVILGAMAATAGLILLALAAVLAEIRRLKGMVGGAMAVMSLAEPRLDTSPAAGAAAPPADGLSPAVREVQDAGLAPALAVGAGALAVGGALAGLAHIGTGRDDAESAAEAGETAEVEKPAEETGASAAAAAAEEPPPAPAPVEHDDWFAPPDPASLHAPVVVPDMAPEPAAEAVEAAPEPGTEPALSEPPTAEAPEAVAEVAGPAGPSAPAAAEDARPETEDEAQPAETVTAQDELWWPKIDRPSRDETLSDEFSALRAELSGLSREVRPAPEPEASPGETPDVEAPRRDLDAVGDWMVPRPWPPVTQPRSLDVPAGAEPEAPVEAPMAEAEEAAPPALEPEPASLAEPPVTVPAGGPAQEVDIAPEAEETPVGEAAAPEPAPEEEGPAASEEGIVGAYQVGETQFTMYADGSIHARTPDGDYVFASMDELKTYLASEKSRLEA